MFRYSKALTSERKPVGILYIRTVSCLCAFSHVEKDAAYGRKLSCILCIRVASHLYECSHVEGAATYWGRLSWVLRFHLAAFLCEFSGVELILTCSRKLCYGFYICTNFQIPDMSNFCHAVISVKVFSQVLCS